MYKLKLPIVLLLIFILSNIFAYSGFATDSTITATKNKITALNVPENGTLIVALYNNGKLFGTKIYSGSDIITADFKADMASSLESANTVKAFLWNVGSLMPLCSHFESLISDLQEETAESNRVKITAGGIEFTATLEDNETASALRAMLPMTLDMSELNGNEKYYYLSESLPTKTESIGTIHAGDIMLYGSSCIVIFYETFNTSYNYTRIGHIDDVTELKSALGNGSVTVTME